MLARTIQKSGTLDEIRKQTWDMKTMAWRKLGGELLASFENNDTSSSDRYLLWPVHKLSNFFLERVLEQPLAKVHMSSPVVDVGQNDHTAWVDVKVDGEIKRMEADFVVGCDGAQSAVRKSLFGSSFPGFTWDNQLVAVNVSVTLQVFQTSANTC